MISFSLALLLGGCAPQDHGVSDVAFTHSPHVLGSATISWTSESIGDGYVEITSPNGQIYAPLSTQGKTSHDVEVRGLPLGRSLTYTVHTDTTSGDEFFSALRGVLMPGPDSLGIPHPALEVYEPSLATVNGYVLISLNHKNGTSTPAILDRFGDIVWAPLAPFSTLLSSAKLTEQGGVVAMQNLMGSPKAKGCIVTNLDGTQMTDSKPYNGHHDALVLGDNIISLGFEHGVVLVDENLVDVGSDTITSTPIGGGSNDTSTLFSFKDHYAAPWRPCEHYDDDAYNMVGVRDFTHTNSLVNFEDHFYIMSLHLDMVLKIDGTDIVWQFGGDLSDYTLKNSDNWFSHGHFSQVLPEGLLVFDNGGHREPNTSRVVEYALDEQTMTAEAVWIYEQPEGLNVNILGDAHRMPNGNTLIAWSTLGELAEVTPDGEVVWRVGVGDGHSIVRASYIQDLYDPFM
jgi:hypothetical protein